MLACNLYSSMFQLLSAIFQNSKQEICGSLLMVVTIYFLLAVVLKTILIHFFTHFVISGVPQYSH